METQALASLKYNEVLTNVWSLSHKGCNGHLEMQMVKEVEKGELAKI
jgi:hypothetical protein